MRPVDGPPGAKVIGAVIAGNPKRTESVEAASWDDSFPPADPALSTMQSAENYSMPPSPGGDGYAIIVGLKSTGVARATIKQFDIDYETAGQQQTLVVQVTFAVCAPPTTQDQCQPEYNGH